MASGLTGLANAAHRLKEDVLSMAVTVQYEAASEPGVQMGVQDMPPEPFTEKQQRQSRMGAARQQFGHRANSAAVYSYVSPGHTRYVLPVECTPSTSPDCDSSTE